MTGIPEREEQVAHIRDYWRIVWRHRWSVGAVFLGVVLATGVWTFMQTPIFRATATVEAQAQARRAMAGPDVSGLGASGFGWSAEERFYSTQLEILRSREMAERVIKALGLRDDPMFVGVRDPALVLSRMVMAELRKDTGIIEVSFSGPDPAKAAELANAYAREFVKRNLDLGAESVRQVVGEMKRQLEPIRTDIEKAESKRFGIAQEEELYVPENQQAIIEANLKSYNEELAKVLISKSDLDAVLAGLEAAAQGGRDVLSIEKIAQDPAIRELTKQRTELEKQIEGLSLKYRRNHPEVQDKLSQIAELQKALDAQVRSLTAGFRMQRDILASRAESLQSFIERTRRESFETGKKTAQYEIAKTDATNQRKLYDQLLQSVKSVSLQADILNNNLTVLDEATIPTGPIRPRTRLNLAMGAMLGLMLGVGIAFFLDYLDNTVKSADDIEQILKLNLLSVIPRYKETTGHAIKEAYQTLRTSVLFSSKGRQHKLLLVTSAGPREGKTSTIVNLARTIASAGEKVVVMDCDLRRPKVHEDLALERDHGLTNYLAGMEAGPYSAFLKPTSVPTLYAMTCGPIPPNPPELFGTDRFRDLLAALRRDFDWVLLDSPPVISLTDAVILASMTDMVAFVIKHNENDRDMIRRCIASIRGVNQNVIGAILNNVDIERGGADYYYTGYYYYYTTDGAEESRTRKRREREARQGRVNVAR